MLTFEQLTKHLMRYNPKTDEAPLTFALFNPSTGEIRLGALWQTVGVGGWYSEISNMPNNYTDPDEEIPGLFRFFCDADLSNNDPLDMAAARFANNLECARRNMFD
jgi:hypothetical protein